MPGSPGEATNLRARITRYVQTFHPVGLAFALQFFAWSMTPSLLPRAWYLQAVATGISLAIGYGLGCLVAWVVRACGISPAWSPRARVVGWWALATVAVVVVPTFLVLGSRWQEIIRDLVGMPHEGRVMYATLLVISPLIAIGLVALGRSIRAGTNRLTHFGARYVPAPTARLISVVLVVALIAIAIDGAVYQGILTVAERSASAADEDTAEGIEQPTSPERSGSPMSLVEWEDLGREGRTFVGSGPTAEQISAGIGRPALPPIRVYAGRESAETIDEVADLVVAELDRTGGFDRAVIAVATTTGSGWVNQNVASALEFVAGGDSAIASMQYSFLPSPMAFLADRDTPREAGRALFEAVYDRWMDMPEDDRPKLVTFGESLGSYGGQDAFSGGYDMHARTDGTLWVGTPNFTEQWAQLTATRDRGSREVLPVIAGGEHIRFAADAGDLRAEGLRSQWTSPRIVYWQHPSDPITWWSFDLLLDAPDWLGEPLSEGVDPGMRWLPIVTFWQVTMDMVFSANVPAGHGHHYGSEAVGLWSEIIGPEIWGAEGWTQADSDRAQVALEEFRSAE